MALHAADGIADDADAMRDGFEFARLGELLDGHGVDVGGKQQGADLIVQIAREVGPLLVLHGRQLLLQALVLRLRACQALDHLVEPMIEAHQLERPVLLHALAIVAVADAGEGGGRGSCSGRTVLASVQ